MNSKRSRHGSSAPRTLLIAMLLSNLEKPRRDHPLACSQGYSLVFLQSGTSAIALPSRHRQINQETCAAFSSNRMRRQETHSQTRPNGLLERLA